MAVRILEGDCRDVLRGLPAESAHCCVTSPPYYGLRDYGVDGQLGLEATPDEYVAAMVGVFREVKRVLRHDATLWLNIGDSYASGGRATYRSGASDNKGQLVQNDMPRPTDAPGIKPKDLLGIPWMLAFALRADGWYLRQDIIWSKPNPMPESVTDRCTKAHEYIFMLSKSARYYYDGDAIKEPCAEATLNDARIGTERLPNFAAAATNFGAGTSVSRRQARNAAGNIGGRNKRSVWTVATAPFSEAHFATFPPALIEPCILASCPRGGTVLDPFFGAGTTGLVADRLGRDCIGIELNAEYAAMTRKRLVADAGMFAQIAAE